VTDCRTGFTPYAGLLLRAVDGVHGEQTEALQGGIRRYQGSWCT